ncbi:hypothetical protein F5Y19DRAFT_245710 [Xylariaceae sp. FL1651]|nr:hypothetical protein F5Y19DRAFT_245710 [Xylariaceae sp. FL1651]
MYGLGIFVLLLAAACAASSVNITSDPVEYLPHRPTSQGGIPISKIGCWNVLLNTEDVQIAKLRMVAWGDHFRIRRRGWHGEYSEDAAVWICNCKFVHRDPIYRRELDHAQDAITERCGQGMAGWVWSKRWQKAFNIGPVEKIQAPKIGDDWCPRNCAWPSRSTQDKHGGTRHGGGRHRGRKHGN